MIAPVSIGHYSQLPHRRGELLPFSNYSDLPINIPLQKPIKVLLDSANPLLIIFNTEWVIFQPETSLDGEGNGVGSLHFLIPGKLVPIVYTGTFKNYQPHGYGVMHFGDGFGIYEGCFENGLPEGMGVHYSYEGKPIRIGQLIFQTEGCFEFILHGIGEYHAANGVKKAGFFDNDRAEGPGILYRDQTRYPVIFHHDQIFRYVSNVTFPDFPFYSPLYSCLGKSHGPCIKTLTSKEIKHMQWLSLPEISEEEHTYSLHCFLFHGKVLGPVKLFDQDNELLLEGFCIQQGGLWRFYHPGELKFQADPPS